MSIFNLVNGVEVECFDEEDDKPARVVIRDSKGKVQAVVIATVQQRTTGSDPPWEPYVQFKIRGEGRG